MRNGKPFIFQYSMCEVKTYGRVDDDAYICSECAFAEME